MAKFRFPAAARIKTSFRTHRRWWAAVLALLLAGYWLCLPSPLFHDPASMVLEARDGSLLGAKIAADGQWRFPHQPAVPSKFAAALVEFEDQRFYRHPGFDLLAFGRAMVQNVRNTSVVSGGSTLTMQVIRLSRKGKSRTVFEKIIEIVLATRLEISFSKKEILAFYASNAPFGGNTVGLDAASWRYFGKNASALSWSEAATLAVLPNSPALIHPGRNRSALQAKRNRLLRRLLEKKQIDPTTYSLAMEEALPDKPLPLPRLAPHLLERAFAENFKSRETPFTRLKTTIDPQLQNWLNDLARRKSNNLQSNGIHNLAIVVMNVETGEVLGYLGNAPEAGRENGGDVDIVKAPRSTGSILKPMLYAMMMNEGKLLPRSLTIDIPTQLSGYRPENYLETYDGIIPADLALARSLNVPFIRLLQEYGVEKFHFNLKKLGLTTLTQPPSHYGLTLVLGGAEGSLWEMTNAYACMARTLGHFYPAQGKYFAGDFRPACYLLPANKEKTEEAVSNAPLLRTDAIWFAFEAMEELQRPTTEGDWQRFESSRRIAWKTGTSFGFRDAWAIGVSPKYAVGVWAGNADGEGRPGLVGVFAAAPILFDIFDFLPASKWFDPPYDAMKKIAVCKQSGYPAMAMCEKDTLYQPGNGLMVKACPFHQLVHLDKTGKWRVTSDCVSPAEMVQVPWFVLPPVEEFYYRTKNPNYRPLPPLRKDCGKSDRQEKALSLIYPKQVTRIYVPVDLNGQLSRTVFRAAHRRPETVVYWHIDNEYIGSTKTFHELELAPPPGKHILTLVDENGERVEQAFEVTAREH